MIFPLMLDFNDGFHFDNDPQWLTVRDAHRDRVGRLYTYHGTTYMKAVLVVDDDEISVDLDSSHSLPLQLIELAVQSQRPAWVTNDAAQVC